MPDDLISLLRAAPLPAAQICQRLGISQPTLSRRCRDANDAVLRFGKARASQYALRRLLGGLRALPLYRIDSTGQLAQAGELLPVQPEGWIAPDDEYLQGLPWYLQDMRPQGFLGRAFARRMAEHLGLDADCTRWTDDAVLQALLIAGNEAPGNWLVGAESASRALAADAAPIPESARAALYPQLAAQALAGELIGSSAGGEQPKFGALTEWNSELCHVLVKFSAPQANPATRRWASLLVAEHLALQALTAAGLDGCESRLLHTGGQTFLEVRRFDRVGQLGRRGTATLAALDGAFVGKGGSAWPAITAALANQRRITPEAHEQAQQRHTFGRLIANTDMHTGNLCFIESGDGLLTQAPLNLAPAYDMLPMHFAPRASGLIPQDLPPLALPDAPLPVVTALLPHALRYWQTVATHPAIDGEFVALAQGMAGQIAVLQTRLGAGLP